MNIKTKTLGNEQVEISTTELFSNCCGVNPNNLDYLGDNIDSEDLNLGLGDNDLAYDYVYLHGICPQCKEHTIFSNCPEELL